MTYSRIAEQDFMAALIGRSETQRHFGLLLSRENILSGILTFIASYMVQKQDGERRKKLGKTKVNNSSFRFRAG